MINYLPKLTLLLNVCVHQLKHLCVNILAQQHELADHESHENDQK